VTYNSGTSTVGIDQTAISITTSQISDITSTAAELNILDGVTATSAEINILDGVTADAAELNILDGVTATTTELNYVDGVTSDIQTQLDVRVLETNGAVTTAATGSNVVRNITLSTSAPSGGSDGDVWLVYEA
jgi:energy-converting hydrogenase Eha subunit G